MGERDRAIRRQDDTDDEARRTADDLSIELHALSPLF